MPPGVEILRHDERVVRTGRTVKGEQDVPGLPTRRAHDHVARRGQLVRHRLRRHRGGGIEEGYTSDVEPSIEYGWQYALVGRFHRERGNPRGWTVTGHCVEVGDIPCHVARR